MKKSAITLTPCPDCATKICWCREFCEEVDPERKARMLAGYEKDLRKIARVKKRKEEEE